MSIARTRNKLLNMNETKNTMKFNRVEKITYNSKKLKTVMSFQTVRKSKWLSYRSKTITDPERMNFKGELSLVSNQQFIIWQDSNA